MSQAPSATVASPQLTNPREVGGFFIAHLIRAGGVFALSLTGALTPLYAWAFRIGHGVMLMAVSTGISVVSMLIMLPIFLVLRGALGGTPATVAGPGGAQAITSTSGEIGAYLLAELIGIAALLVLSGLVLSPLIYGPLHRSGHTVLAPVIATAIGLVMAAVVFLIFVSLRRAFAGSSSS